MSVIKNAARAAGLDLFRYDGSRVHSLDVTAENLTAGRTHYFSNGTRRFHGSRVCKLSELSEGLVLGFIERVSLDFEHTRKGYRPGFVAVDGYVFDRPNMEDSFSTKRAAEREFWRLANLHDSAEIFGAILARQSSEALRSLQNVEAARAILAKGAAE